MTDRPRYADKAARDKMYLTTNWTPLIGELCAALDYLDARLSEAVVREAGAAHLHEYHCKLREALIPCSPSLSDAAREILEKARNYDALGDESVLKLLVAERDSLRADAEKLQRDHAALKGDIEVEREGAGYLRTKLTWATKERQAMEKREARCLHDCVHHEGCVLLVGGERRAHSLSCISHISCKPCDCGLVELGEDE